MGATRKFCPQGKLHRAMRHDAHIVTAVIAGFPLLCSSQLIAKSTKQVKFCHSTLDKALSYLYRKHAYCSMVSCHCAVVRALKIADAAPDNKGEGSFLQPSTSLQVINSADLPCRTAVWFRCLVFIYSKEKGAFTPEWNRKCSTGRFIIEAHALSLCTILFLWRLKACLCSQLGGEYAGIFLFFSLAQ